MPTVAQIRPFLDMLRCDDNARAGRRLEELLGRRGSTRRPLYLTTSDLNQILKWKLRGQYGRQRKVRAKNTTRAIRAITTAAFAIRDRHPIRELELRVRVLCALHGVGVPVASAVLAVAEPRKYGVIDFRAWRQVFPNAKKSGFTVLRSAHLTGHFE